jgi:hypothetical protein
MAIAVVIKEAVVETIAAEAAAVEIAAEVVAVATAVAVAEPVVVENAVKSTAVCDSYLKKAVPLQPFYSKDLIQ